MKIFIEGPHWSGMWTEIIADCLQQAGHRVGINYHNRKTLRDRISLAGQAWRPGYNRKSAWATRHRKQLVEAMSHEQWDILLSIQGTLDRDTVQHCRQHSPGLQIFYWWGDILTEQAHARISTAAGFSKYILVSGKGSYDELSLLYPDQVRYFPFGVAARFHTVSELSPQDLKRFTAEVAFVGTCYPERCELIRYLNSRLNTPVKVWGRGWRHCKDIHSHGALSLADSLKVHACSKISLNLHHANTNNGFNMKFYEIPAAGGLQICDWQPLMDETALGQQTVACRSFEDFAGKTSYYLAHQQQRQQIIETTSKTVFTTEEYTTRLAELFNQTS